MHGTVVRTPEGRFALTFERHLPHPPIRVWHAITDSAQLAAWFPASVDVVPIPGTMLRFDPTAHQTERFGLTTEDATFGQVLRAEPERLLEFRWDQDTLRWELGPDDVHGTHLRFTHEIDDATALPPLAAGWHAGLEVLEAQLAGEPVTWSMWERAEQLEDEYAHLMP